MLVTLGGRDIDVRFAEELPLFNQFVMRLPRGKPIAATVLRGGAEKTLSVVAEERESVEARVRELPALGITASNLTAWSAKELQTARIAPACASTASGREVRRPKRSRRSTDDDVIVAIDGKAVANVEALIAHEARLTAEQAAPVRALVDVRAARRAPADRASRSAGRRSGIPASKRERRGYR